MSEPELEVRRRIARRGRIPFAEVMDLCLYGPGGYYTGAELPIGEQGDFVTGSSFSPLFGRSTARLLERLGRVLGGRCDYLEVGYGNGAHLRSLLDAGPKNGGGRFFAVDRVHRPVPEGVETPGSLDEVADRSVDGLVFSYELFDALPVHRLIAGPGGVLEELWVGESAGGELEWRQAALSDPSLEELLEGVEVEVGQIVDVSPEWAPLYRSLVGKLKRGLVVTCDYGFERRRLVDARVRRHGTLACYSRQRVHRNPLVLLGRQDLTAHIDFTALVAAGEAAGLETVALSRQALWLLATGVFEDLDGADASTREQAMSLLDGDGMGQDIRVLVQARGVDVGAVLRSHLLG